MVAHRGSKANKTHNDVGVDLAAVARLLAEDTRADICLALLDGRAWTARELAQHAGVAPSTATEHLNLLVSGGLLTEERHGRHRYLRLAGPKVTALIESLAELAPRRPTRPRSLSATGRARALARARLCYDHLAGTLGLAVTDALVAGGLITWEPEPRLTPTGAARLTEHGIELPTATRRPPVRSCLDWTERRPHLGGAVGAAICSHALDEGWVTRIGTGRALALTAPGRQAFRDRFHVPEDRLPV